MQHWTAYHNSSGRPHNVVRQAVFDELADCGLAEFAVSVDGYSYAMIRHGKTYPLTRQNYILTPIRCYYDSKTGEYSWTI